MIDRKLNYGRHAIKEFLTAIPRVRAVLDVGAGTGADLDIVREIHPSADLFALDFSPSVAENLRAKGVDVRLINIERERFPLKMESVDIVMANQILEHTKEIFWIFDQISRVLRVGGHLIIGVPNLAALHNRILLAIGRQPSQLQNNSAHVRGFTKSDVLKFVATGFPDGYKLYGFKGTNFYPFPPLLAKPLAVAFPTLAWGIFFCLRKVKTYSGEFIEYPRREHLETNFFLGTS